ncbi:MAG: hypothetical protein BroJett011_69380 [Chloroflexota bacterium]|nr:MAG: hypothetical protein BroJett011_69380 [Chloroflexota bacterium]
MPPASQPKPGVARTSFLALLQLAVFLLGLWWAWQAWQSTDGIPNDRFWAAMALALFAGGLAQINLIGPLRERFTPMPASRLALPVRLYPDGTPQDLVWPMFSLAFAFGAPFPPLLMLIITAETGWMVELRLIWIGLALLSLFVTGVGIYMGGRALYRRLSGGQTIIEVETGTAQAGQTVQGFVWHQSGRIPSERIEVALVGRETLTRRGRPTRTETTDLYREVVVPAVMLDLAAGPWQKNFAFTIPEDAPSSAPHTANPMVIWGLDVQVNLKDAPDLTLTFPFTVHGIEPDEEEDQELDEAEADFGENDSTR